jgi:hypothetical protein
MLVETSDRLWIASPSRPNRAGHHRKKQLDDARDSQPGGADRDRAVGFAPVLGVVAQPGQRKGSGRVPDPGGLVHFLRIAGSRYRQQTG